MVADGNVDGQWSGEKMREDDGMRKVECLRGRLLAERAASKHAKEEADQMENKLEELENQLKLEIRSRKRADKRLKSLIKKLESLNIPYFSEESENSSFLERSEVSSVSSTASCATKPVEDKYPKTQIRNHEKCEIEKSDQKEKFQTGYKAMEDNVSQISTSNQSKSSPVEESLSAVDKAIESSEGYNDSQMDLGSSRLRSSVEKEDIKEGISYQSQDDYVSQISSSNQSNDPSSEECLSSAEKGICEESYENNSKMDDQIHSFSIPRDSLDQKDDTNETQSDEAQDDIVDNSMALVVVDSPEPPGQAPIDPLVLDANVKQVLDALGHARQKLLLSMERRHIIRVGSK